MINAIRVFLLRLFAPSKDPRLDEEIATHIEMLASEFQRKGMTAEEARAAARREFGSIMRMREEHRARRRLPQVDSVVQDVGYAFRQLRANPGFLAAAVITLGLGIGANTAIFDNLDRIVLRSLPVADPDRLVALRANQAFGVPLLREMNARQNLVEGIFASGPADIRQASLDGRELTESAVVYATGNYFRILGVQPQIGRLLTEADNDPSAPAAAAVISDRFWRREFGGQATVLGRSIRLKNFTVTVIGVTQPEFYGERLGRIPDIWLPMSIVGQLSPGMETRSVAWLTPMARLRNDVSFDQAQAGLAVLLNQLMPDFGLQVKGVTDYRLNLLPARQGLGRLHAEFSTPLWLLMGLVTLVVLIACCNLATLLLARGSARAHEIGVRLAIGAGRGRVIRQLLTESLVIAVISGALGLGIGYWGSHALTTLILGGEKQDLMTGFGWSVAGFAALLSMLSLCIFGMTPALTASRINLGSALQAGRHTHTGGGQRRSVMKCFAFVQLAISMVLISGACLLVSSFWKLVHEDMGYSRDGILTFHPAFDATTFSTFRNPVLRQSLFEGLNAIPGIQSAAFLQGGPLGFVTENAVVALPDRAPRAGERFRRVDVSARYFETMGIQILTGRPIDVSDQSGTMRVAVITETAARRLFGAADPIGRVFTNGPELNSADGIQIVGVARDVRLSSVREPFAEVLFLPITQVRSYTTPVWVLRTGPRPMRFAESVRQAVREIAPNLRIEQLQPWDEIVGLTVRKERLLAWLSGGFAVLAIVLASVGVYGVVAYSAERRIPEIGVRLALGASPQQLRAMFLKEITIVLFLGLTLGGGTTLMLGKWVRSILFELTPHDPITLASAAGLLTIVVLAAAYLPARRAARLDPVIALRQE